MDVLILVHIENVFRDKFPYDYLTIMQECAEKYDRIIHCTSCIDDLHPCPEIRWMVGQEIDWSWGYEPEVFEDDPNELVWVIPASGHEYTWVPEELREGASLWRLLKQSTVHVGGGFETECLQDFLDVLDYVEIDYSVVRDYVYG